MILRPSESIDVPLPASEIARLAKTYLWWDVPGGHSPARVVAQAMDLGTWEDIRRLETSLGRDVLLALMRAAEPGWLGPRSWDFWRGRLGADTLPAWPPRRSFDARSD